MDRQSKIYVAGHTGLVGSAVVRKLCSVGYTNILTCTHDNLDLTDQHAVYAYIAENRPDAVIMCAGVVGGIQANSDSPATFLLDNASMAINVVTACQRSDVRRLVYLGSSCIYPNDIDTAITEDRLLTSKLEPTNEGYALAKILGIKAVEMANRQYGTSYISLMPCNLYGIGDNFHLRNSHVLPALLRRFHEAKVLGSEAVTLWGDGTPLREFLYVDDLASAIMIMLESDTPGTHLLNVGSGEEVSIKTLAHKVATCVQYKGTITWDTTRPNGTKRKLMDSSKIRKYGWEPVVSLDEGIRLLYNWYIQNEKDIRSLSST